MSQVFSATHMQCETYAALQCVDGGAATVSETGPGRWRRSRFAHGTGKLRMHVEQR